MATSSNRRKWFKNVAGGLAAGAVVVDSEKKRMEELRKRTSYTKKELKPDRIVRSADENKLEFVKDIQTSIPKYSFDSQTMFCGTTIGVFDQSCKCAPDIDCPDCISREVCEIPFNERYLYPLQLGSEPKAKPKRERKLRFTKIT